MDISITKVLIFSEDVQTKGELKKLLLDSGYNPIEAKRLFNQDLPLHTALIIFDASHSEDESSSFIGHLKVVNPLIPMIVLVKQGDVGRAVQMMKMGVSSVLELPIDRTQLLSHINNEILPQDRFPHDQKVLHHAIHLLQSLLPRNEHYFSTRKNGEEQITAASTHRDKFLRIGELIVHIEEQKAFYQKKLIDLTFSQFRILAYLAEAKGRVVTFDELYFHLHETRLDRSSARTALSSHMSYLRHKLIDAGCGDYLVNIRGRGYSIENAEERNAHLIKANLDLILEQLPIILWTTDTHLRITSILGAGLKTLNIQASELVGLALPNAMRFEELAPTINAHEQALLGKSLSYEQEIRGRILEIYVEPSLNQNDEIVGCIAIALDITERKEAEEAYQLLVDHSMQGLMIMQNRQIVFANRTMTEITGYTTEEILSIEDPLQKLIYSEDLPRILNIVQRRLAGEDVPAKIEYRMSHKDGSIRWIEQETFVNKLRGQIVLHAAATDRTQEKQALESYRQLEEMYRILARNLPKMAVLIFDVNLRYIIVEGQALEEVGYHRHSMEGKTIWDVLPKDRASRLEPYYRKALDGDESTFDWISNDRIYEIQTLPVRNEQEQIVGGMFIIQDVTRHRH